MFVRALCASAGAALAGPVTTPLDVPGPDDCAAVAASAMGGYTALADTFDDRVIVLRAGGAVARTITRPEIDALAPWLDLDGGPDGVNSLAFTSTGKQLFIGVHDDTVAGDGGASDAVLRYDLAADTLTLVARVELYGRGDRFPHLAMAHWRAALYVGSDSGHIRAFTANSAAASGAMLAAWTLPTGGAIRGLAVDRDASTLFAANEAAVYRTVLTNDFSTPPVWTLVANTSGVRGLAWGDAYGTAGTRGLYILRDPGAGSGIDFVSAAAAHGPGPAAPAPYWSSPDLWHAVSARGDGALVIGRGEDAVLMRESADTLPGFDAWAADEFNQVVAFGRGLISPDGEPSGWVIDADTTPSLARFHPASPDGAAWTVLLLLAADRVNGDALARAQVRSVLARYAGLAADGISPHRSADGIYLHWIDPATGGPKPGWGVEYATMSTMLLAAAAARAAEFYPDDPGIVRAASRIIFRVRNWDSYVRPSDRAMYLTALAGGGPSPGSVSLPWHEGVLFVEQAAFYGGAASQSALGHWMNRAVLPSASYIPGQPITTAANNVFSPAFISVYPALLMPSFRAGASWRQQVRNVRWAHAAWTDDFGPRFSTVFSAGTTRADWGGYHADSLSDHPGDVATFPSLTGLSTLGEEDPAYGAYHAFRRGARQTFRTGASILYRRSDLDRLYLPNSAGLPDVAPGGLGLAEIIVPGITDAVLSRPYPTQERCPTDVNGNGIVNTDDLYLVCRFPTDLNGDGAANDADWQGQENWLRRRERTALITR